MCARDINRIVVGIEGGDDDVALTHAAGFRRLRDDGEATDAFYFIELDPTERLGACVEINQCDGCTRQFFTKSFLGDDAADWLGRAARNRHRHAIEQACVDGVEDDATIQHECAIKFSFPHSLAPTTTSTVS